eukprot:CAMPEP_0116946990 /NCGR_PEP_ID=MMETSP0467-20121206/37372_1 /TAXON_ID=283647 /ORGANISM="Mesodinium pulex, Strain SPMC105" /LENGTH=114 /DNA_ID=CAMNT_0004630989 /DNA_START=626 /DNA_END=970 /DNA_ORIENTATION=+
MSAGSLRLYLVASYAPPCYKNLSELSSYLSLGLGLNVKPFPLTSGEFYEGISKLEFTPLVWMKDFPATAAKLSLISNRSFRVLDLKAELPLPNRGLAIKISPSLGPQVPLSGVS